MLFSEPKIPQSCTHINVRTTGNVSVLFSEPKIPQCSRVSSPSTPRSRCFSALQRAENSSITKRSGALTRQPAFQCSSASRKFLNPDYGYATYTLDESFQCSSASRKFLNRRPFSRCCATSTVSVLFSEPKIPQLVFGDDVPTRTEKFQCSSASRKFLNCGGVVPGAAESIVSVLFSEPKIPQSGARCWRERRRGRFQCSSASRKFLNSHMDSPSRKFSKVSVLFSEPKIPQSFGTRRASPATVEFQCSSASRKFLNYRALRRWRGSASVSVLFSEPKIPQSGSTFHRRRRIACFSALQRAENSSMGLNVAGFDTNAPFQCSSASRKFLNRRRTEEGRAKTRVSVLFSEPKIPQSGSFDGARPDRLSFSALQRAENSSIRLRRCVVDGDRSFQCSSASRKFLNSSACRTSKRAARVSVLFSEPKIPQCDGTDAVTSILPRFSALQRAENSSMMMPARAVPLCWSFSALQRAENSSIDGTDAVTSILPRFSALQRAENSSIVQDDPDLPASYEVSVLFSEPKIPQFFRLPHIETRRTCFSALQRAENSSIGRSAGEVFVQREFQCSSASRKFLNTNARICATSACNGFSALQRAENSSIEIRKRIPHAVPLVSVLFSEPKIPQSTLLTLTR